MRVDMKLGPHSPKHKLAIARFSAEDRADQDRCVRR